MSSSKEKEMGVFQRDGVETEEKMYVAVSKEVRESRSVLTWALQNSGGKTVCLIHVHERAKKIPNLENEKSFRERGREEMFAVPNEYLRISQKFGVPVEKLYIETDSIEKGIIQLIEQHNIEKLVIGAASDQHYSRKMVEVKSKKATYVKDNAPSSCHIWFICNGYLIHTREAINQTAACALSPSRFSTDSIGMDTDKYNYDDPVERDLIMAEIARRAAFRESMRQRKVNKVALSNAICKAETAERLYNEEIKIRIAKEAELAKENEAIETMKNLRVTTSFELRKTMAHKFSLEKQMEKLNLSLKESEEKYLSVVELLKTYKFENEELETERDNALQDGEILREQLAYIGPLMSHADVLGVFSSSDLKKATIHFDESLKIREVGYGTIYKGFLRDTKVSIKILNPKSLSHGPRQFHLEVNILSDLKHPNLVTLIGTCPETCALVYEYLPGGSLEDRLVCKDNAPPLLWQTRIQIAMDLCSVLIFLHLSRPRCIVHGKLRPSNVLLDANCVCKLSNLGTLEKDSFDSKEARVYIDPEIQHTGQVTTTSDIYSFGIILLRLLTGKPALGIIEETSDFSRGSIGSKLDPSAGEWPLVQAEQLVCMALRCCDWEHKNRPDLGSDVWGVLKSMKSSSQSLSIPQLASNNQAPNYFMCPIFQEVMEDPHIASDGFTYEAEAIRGWFDSDHDNSPMTNVTLTNHNLTPNRALRSAIQEWRLHSGGG